MIESVNTLRTVVVDLVASDEQQLSPLERDFRSPAPLSCSTRKRLHELACCEDKDTLT